MALERREKPKLIQLGDRQQITVIVGIYATRQAIPPFIVYAGKRHISTQYEDASIPSDQVITISKNGQTNNKLSLAQLKYFNAYIKGRIKGTYQLLVIDSYKSYNLIDFQDYYKEYKIITIYIPTYLSYLLQPLDVGYFSPIKKAYSTKILDLAYQLITYIIKVKFFSTFKTTFLKVFSKDIIKGTFYSTRLVLLNLEEVLQYLDVQLRTPSLPIEDTTTQESRIPSNLREFEAQSTLVYKRIRDYLNLSPTLIIQILEKLKKGTLSTIYSQVLVLNEIIGLYKTIKETIKQKLRKRKYIQC